MAQAASVVRTGAGMVVGGRLQVEEPTLSRGTPGKTADRRTLAIADLPESPRTVELIVVCFVARWIRGGAVTLPGESYFFCFAPCRVTMGT